MAILSDQDSNALRARLESDLAGLVKVELFTEHDSGLYVPGRRSCVTCKDTQELLEEFAVLSEKVELSIHDVREEPELAAARDVSLTPTISIHAGLDAGVRMLGLPSGYEFASFLETVISAGSENNFDLEAETIERLEALESDIDVKVFSTPT